MRLKQKCPRRPFGLEIVQPHGLDAAPLRIGDREYPVVRFAQIPGFLETPGGPPAWKRAIARLRRGTRGARSVKR